MVVIRALLLNLKVPLLLCFESYAAHVKSLYLSKASSCFPISAMYLFILFGKSIKEYFLESRCSIKTCFIVNVFLYFVDKT